MSQWNSAPRLPEWNFCKPVPFAIAHMGNVLEKNGCLAVKQKSIKLTYDETVRLKDSVEAQNRLIAKGGATDSILNDLSTKDQVKVDIKTK